MVRRAQRINEPVRNSLGTKETLYIRAVKELLHQCFDRSGIYPGRQVNWSERLVEIVLTFWNAAPGVEERYLGPRYFYNLYGDISGSLTDPYQAINLTTESIGLIGHYLGLDYQRFNQGFAPPVKPPGYDERRYRTNIPQERSTVVRTELMQQLRQATGHTPHPVIALSGMPGVGKTTLAREFARTEAPAYPGGCWLISAPGKHLDIRNRLKSFAQMEWGLSFTEDELKDDRLAWVRIKDHLESPFFYDHQQLTLLIFDNIDEPAESFSDQFLDTYPLKYVHILFTTRSPGHRSKYVSWISVDHLSEEESEAMLSLSRPAANAVEKEAARLIALRLNGFALALSIVSGQLQINQDASYADILADLEAEGLDFLDYAGNDQNSFAVNSSAVSLLRLALPILEKLTKAALRLTDYLAWFPPDQVYLPWLCELLETELPEEFKNLKFKSGLTDWQKTVRHLTELNLLQITSSPDVVRIHRVWQEILLHQETRKAEQTDALRSLANYTAVLIERATGRSHLEAFHSQLLPLAALIEKNMDAQVFNSRTFNNLGVIDIESGNYLRAREWIKRAIALDQQTLGEDHQLFGNHYSNLGFIESQLGNFAVGKSWLEKAMEIDDRFLPPGHRSFGMHFSNLADAEMQMGRYHEAKALMEKAIAIEKKNYPKGDPQIAAGFAKMAHIEHRLRNFDAAIQWAEKAFSIDKFNYPVTHPKAAAHYNNIGYMEIDRGNFAAARRALLKSVDIYSSHFHNGHPQLNDAYFNMGSLEINEGNYHEAVRWLQKSLDFTISSYGKDAFQNASALAQMGYAELYLINFGRARALLEEAVRIYDLYLEADNPARLPGYYFMSALESKLTNYVAARDWMRRAFDIETLHPKEPGQGSDMTIYMNMSSNEMDAGNLTEAKDLVEKAIRIGIKEGLRDNPRLATAYGNLAIVEMNLGDDKEAIKHVEKAIELCKRRFRADHPHLATNYAVLGLLEQKRKAYASARKWLLKSIALTEKNGVSGLAILTTRYYRLALVETESGDPSAALTWLEKAVAKQLLFELHTDLGVYYQTIADTELLLSHPAAAAEFYHKAYHVFRVTEGEEDARAIRCRELSEGYSSKK